MATKTRLDIVAPLHVLAAASLWGTTGVAAKYLFSAHASPFYLAAARVMVTSVVVGLYMLSTTRSSFVVAKRDIPHLAVFGILGVALCQLSYIYAVTQANVGVAVLLQSLAPAFAYLYSLLVRQERFSWAKVSALLLAISGGAAVVSGKGGWGGAISLTGMVSGIVSGLCWAYYGIRAKNWLGTYSPWTLLFYGNGFAMVFWWLFLSPRLIVTWLASTPAAFPVVLYLAVVCTAVPSWLFLRGVKALRPSTAGIIGTFEPVAASLFAFLLLRETLSLHQLVGGLLIVTALTLLQATTVATEIDTSYRHSA